MESARSKKMINTILINGTLALLVIIWLIPTIGILVSSFRERFDIQTTGWWSVFPHKDWVHTRTIDVRELGLDPSGPMEIEGTTATFEELRAGVQTPDGKRMILP